MKLLSHSMMAHLIGEKSRILYHVTASSELNGYTIMGKTSTVTIRKVYDDENIKIEAKMNSASY